MNPAERERAILSLRRVVGVLAWQFAQRSGVDVDELIAVAWEGAIKAVDRYDPNQAVKLSTYATHRIRGALLDYARIEDHLSVATRRRVSASTLEADSFQPPLSLQLELETRPALADTLPSDRDEWEPEAVALSTDMGIRLDAAMRELPERERMIIQR